MWKKKMNVYRDVKKEWMCIGMEKRINVYRDVKNEWMCTGMRKKK